MKNLFLLLLCATILVSGCKDPNAPAVAEKVENEMEDDGQGIFNKKTQDIAEFDPDAEDQVVVDDKVEGMSPLNPLNSLKAYGPMLQKISRMHIDQALRLFEAEHGRMPKDYDEFMERIIKMNNIQLPVLPGDKQYQYDSTNHCLVIADNKEKK